MIRDSAWITTSQLWPLLSSAVDITAKPLPRAYWALSAMSEAGKGGAVPPAMLSRLAGA